MTPSSPTEPDPTPVSDGDDPADQDAGSGEAGSTEADETPELDESEGSGSHPLGSRVHPGPRRTVLMQQRSPLAVGFMFTVGALIAIALAQTAMIAQNILVVIMLALFLALGLNPLVNRLINRGLPRSIAVLTVVLGAVGLFALALWAIIPVATSQLTTLVTDGPALLQATRDHPLVRDLDERFNVISRLVDALGDPNLSNQLFGGVLGAGQIVISLVVQGVAMAVLTIYFLASLPMIQKAIYGLSPKSRRPRMRYLCDEVFEKLGDYLSGLFVIVTLAGTGTFIMLMLNGLGEYALALAVVVALLDFIPLVGPTIGMVIVTTVAFVNSPTQGIIALVYYILYTQSEAYLIYPRVMARSVDVPGVVTVTAALLGGTLLGIAGALIAVPTAAVFLLLWREVVQPHLDSS